MTAEKGKPKKGIDIHPSLKEREGRFGRGRNERGDARYT